MHSLRTSLACAARGEINIATEDLEDRRMSPEM